MIGFRAPELSDKPWVDALLAQADYRGCEYNFTNLYAWQQAYRHEIAQQDGFLLAHLCGGLGCSYLYPAGRGDIAPVIRALQQEADTRAQPLRLVCLTNRQMDELDRLFPGQFAYEPDRPGFDYLYEIDRLADLGGKKLHAKRNHINRFLEEHPDWVFQPLDAGNLDECLEMDAEWSRLSRAREGAEEEEHLRDETAALRCALRDFVPLGLEGGLIRVAGRVVAFSAGDRLCSDTFDVHFEKAFGEMQGAYAMINRSFARAVRARHPEIRYLNREDDMGVEGLRKAKESYDPALMVQKYSAVLRAALR